MMSRRTLFLGFFLCLQTAVFGAKQSSVLDFKQVLKMAIEHHPTTLADRFREEAVESEIGVARAMFYPRLYGMALELTGFPGSAAATEIEGVMISPFHKGASAGLFVKQELFDFGRTWTSVTVAQKRLDLARSQSRVSHIDIGTQAAKLFSRCAQRKGLSTIFDALVVEARAIEKEVKRFVRTGQRSVVDGYLSESQTEMVITAAADFKQRYEFDRAQLLAYLSDEAVTAECPSMTDEVAGSAMGRGEREFVSPVLLKAQADAEVVHATVSRARKDYLPRIVGMASLGAMQGSLVVPVQNWSAAVGFIFPIFEGFKTNSQVDAALAQGLQKEKEVNAIKLNLKETFLDYAEEIGSAKIRMTHLDHELEVAETGFNVAKKRYFSQLGTLIDLREAFQNVMRVQKDLKRAQSDLLIKSAEKGLLDGSLLAEIGK